MWINFAMINLLYGLGINLAFCRELIHQGEGMFLFDHPFSENGLLGGLGGVRFVDNYRLGNGEF